MPLAVETYVSFTNRNKARLFEKYLKTGSRKAFLRKRLIDYSSLTLRGSNPTKRQRSRVA